MSKFPFHQWLFVLILTFLIHESFESRILILTPMGSKSHKNYFMSIADGLAANDHEVTMVSTFKDSKRRKGIRDVALPVKDARVFLENIFDEEVQAGLVKAFMNDASPLCIEGLKTKEIQDLLKEDFDLVILSLFFDFCYLSLVHQFKAPLVYASSAGLMPPMDSTTGNIMFPALSKNVLLPGTSFPFSFMDRFKSSVLTIALEVVGHVFLLPNMEKACREAGMCPADMPSFLELSHNSSLVIINRVRLLDHPPTPSMPNLIYSGGIHCHEAKPLPQELEDWVSKSDHGFIFFSLGSAVTPTDMPEEYRKILVKVFGSLKQRVIWKWNLETMNDLPPNVRLGKWLPQQDILGHKNLKLFITHGGLLSTLESTYHGIPILGMPIFFDQHNNIEECVSEGWASSIKWKDLEEESFRQLILDTINNKEFKKIASKRSGIMKDLPRHPKDEVVYWIEYVLKYGGADHIKSPLTKMPTYQLYNMDVWALLLAALLATIALILTLLKCLYKACFKRNSKPEKKKKRA